MKKIALVFLGDHAYDGRCVNMINTLVDNNNHITIYNSKKKPTTKKTHKSIKIVNIRSSSYPILKYLDWWNKIYAHIKKQSFDVIIAADFYSLVPLCFMKKKATLVFDSREIYSKLSIHVYCPIKNLIIKLLENFCLSKIKKIIVTAKSDKEILMRLYPQKKLFYQVIYNYPPKKLIKKNSSYFNKNLNIPTSKTILLYQGVIQKHRGIRQLIKIIENTQNTVGVIIGDGEYENYIQQYIQQKKLNHRIHLLCALPYVDLLSITSAADIGVSLIQPHGVSNTYALPNKLFEYALSGIPTLASNLPNMAKYISDYNLGWCVEPKNLSQQIKIVQDYQILQKEELSFNLNDNISLSWESQQSVFLNFILNEIK